MKQYFPIFLALVCSLLVISLIMSKRADKAQLKDKASAIADFSNRWTSAQQQIASRDGTILTLSNTLNEGRSAFLMFSNQAGSTIALDQVQIARLNQRVAEVESENQFWGQRLLEASNRIIGLTSQMALTEANLAQTNNDLMQLYKDYALLENRLRRDVAERTVVERKFNNLSELKAQTQKLKKNPPAVISAENIYAGLNVEIKSNGTFHVLSPD